MTAGISTRQSLLNSMDPGTHAGPMIQPRLFGAAALACALAFGLLANLEGADAPRPSPTYETRAVHDPNGIGKYYMGREIAHVMGHQFADWLERATRDEEEHTGKLVDE